MTDQYSGVLVTFEKDIRKDDAQSLINAIKMIKGVISVDPQISDYEHLMAKSQAKHELIQSLFQVLK